MWNVSDGDFPLAEAAVFAVLQSLLSLLFRRQRIIEDSDAPPHHHIWRLCYKVAELLVNRLRYLSPRHRNPFSLLSEANRIRLMTETTAEEV